VIEKLPIDDAAALLIRKALNLDGHFPDLKGVDVEMIFFRSGLYLYPKWSCLVEQSQIGRHVYVVERGELAVYHDVNGDKKLVGTLRRGDVFGEIGLLRGGIRTATVVAERESRVFQLHYRDIEFMLKHNPDVGSRLERLANKRVQLLKSAGKLKK